jgi:FlaA1/EpsC-like NDP-sugar epimerase
MKEVENQTAGDMIHKFHIKKVIEEMTHQFQLKSRKNQLVMMNKVSDVHNTMKGLQDGMSNHIQKIDHQDLLSRDAKAPEVKMLKQPTTSMANKLKMKKKKKHPSKSKNPTLVYQEN